MKQSVKVSATILYFFMICLNVAAKDFYLETWGKDDSGNGSKTRPWRTLAYACSMLPEKSTLHIGRGNFMEYKQSVVPNGVSLIGSGKDKTFIIANCCKYSLTEYTPVPEKYLITVIGSSNATFSDFTIDGNNKLAHGGLLMHYSNNFNIHDIRARLFNFCGIWITDSKQVNIYSLDIQNCAWPNDKSCSGAIMLGNLENSKLHDSNIRDDRAYGVKVWSFDWNDHEPYLSRNFEKSRFTNVDIYNLHIKVEPKGAWAKGMSPNFTMEFWSCDLVNCKLHDCDFNETVSIPEPGIAAPHTLEVYRNRFIMPDDRAIPSYAMEALCANLVVHDNYFKGGYYPIASFGGTAKGQRIFNNVFHDIWGIAVINHNAMVNCNIFNNTIYGIADMPFLKFGGKDLSIHNQIHHNLFYSHGQVVKQPLIKYPADKAPDTASLSISQNWFFNWKVTGDKYLTGNPFLKKTGKIPNSFFSFQKTSPLLKLCIGSHSLNLKTIED